MNTLDSIYSRKSVRSYTGEALTDAQLAELLKAAYAAPVGMGRYETLRLTVVTNGDYLDRLDKAACAAMQGRREHPLYGAPCLIVVSSEGPPDNVNFSNAAIVVHNMALAATEMGLGACHIWGAVRVINGSPEFLAELGLPGGFAPCCALAVGATEEKYEPREIPDGRIATDYLR